MSARARAAGRGLLLVAAVLGCAQGAVRPPERGPGAGLPTPASPPPARAVLVTIAGLGEAALGADLPNLAALAEGGQAVALSGVAPLSAYPLHATLVTGEPPARHGVGGDHLLTPEGVANARPYHVRHLAAPTLYAPFDAAGLRVAAIGWPGSAGAPAAFVFPEVFALRPGDAVLELLEEVSTPGMVELARRLGATEAVLEAPGADRDGLLVAMGCALLGAPAPPALTLLRLSGAEPVLRREGPGTEAAAEALRAVDHEVGRLIGCLRAFGRLRDTLLLVVGEGGYRAVHTRVSPNAALAGAGLLRLDGAGGLEWQAIARASGGSALVYARGGAAALRAREVLGQLAERTRAFRIVDAAELLRLRADPQAWFGLEARAGFVFDEAPAGPRVAPSARRGTSGYLHPGPGLGPVLVAHGPGVGGARAAAGVALEDVAPTLAAALSVPFAAESGRPVAALFGGRVAAAPGSAGRSPGAGGGGRGSRGDR